MLRKVKQLFHEPCILVDHEHANQWIHLCGTSVVVKSKHMNSPNKGNNTMDWIVFFSFTKISKSAQWFFFYNNLTFLWSCWMMRLYQIRMQGKLIFRALFFIRKQIYRNLECFHSFVQTALATSRLQTPQGEDFYLPAPGAVWDTCKWYSIVCGWAAQAWLWYCVCAVHFIWFDKW